MPTPEISKITLDHNGTLTTYNIKDEVARQAASGGITLRGETTTPLTDMATTNPITINGDSYTAVNQDAVFYDHKEFVFDGMYWHEFGDLTGLGDLALKDDASGSYTPAGTVTQPSFTGQAMTATGTFTPDGSVSAPTITVDTAGATTTVNSITDVGTLPTLTTTVVNETLTISFSQGTLPSKGSDTTVKTGDATYTASAPTFTGTQGSVSVAGTPEGTVSQPTFSGTAATITVS